MSTPTKAQLIATAAALGLDKSKRERMTKDQLRDWIAGHREEHDREGHGVQTDKEPPVPVKPARPRPGPGFQPKMGQGHIVILRKLPEGADLGPNVEAGQALYGFMDEEGNLHLHDSEGNEIGTLPAGSFQFGEHVDNTGIERGDIVRREGEYLVVEGTTKGGAFAVREFGSSGTEFVPNKPYINVNGNCWIDDSVRRYTWEELVAHDFYFWDQDQLELTQDAVNYLAKLEAIDITHMDREAGFGIDPLTLTDGTPLVPGLSELRSSLNSDKPLPFSSHAAMASSHGLWVVPQVNHDPSGAFLSAAVKASISGAASIPFSLELLESGLEEQQQNQEDSQQQQNQAPEEGRMEKSRKGLGDLKTQPQEHNKQVVPSERLRELVEEAMGDSEKLGNAVMRTINKHREEFRQALGLDENFRELAQNMLTDIEQAFEEHERNLSEWQHATEQKLVSKVTFDIPEIPEFDITDPHYKFEDLLFNAVLREPTLMVGPSGSGKTTAARMVSDALGLPFGYMALGPTQTEVKVSGYPDAQGVFVATEFYLRYKYGGVFLFDEIDAANPSALVWINGAIQNRMAAFPRGVMSRLEAEGYAEEAEAFREGGGQVEMHKDCVILASANTYGKGADLVYQGRNALDGATLKRFLVLEWNYDEALERKLAGDDLWVDFVQAVRFSTQEQRLEHIVSPVDSIRGAKMLAAGAHWHKVVMQTVFAGLQTEEIKKIAQNTDAKINGKPVASVVTDLKNKLATRFDERQQQNEGDHASA